ncbi:hypothetical protein GWK47_002801 [Chionoecetes opilio]|uniref:Uncharacterized protein n=1 Tax=Chionoecetes opilio TaxID=41210 RepID=A0A8J4XPH8_CHIOP|nr:hypothetical protein GWK47_002801 [Chionoecetes opilio]
MQENRFKKSKKFANKLKHPLEKDMARGSFQTKRTFCQDQTHNSQNNRINTRHAGNWKEGARGQKRPSAGGGVVVAVTETRGAGGPLPHLVLQEGAGNKHPTAGNWKEWREVKAPAGEVCRAVTCNRVGAQAVPCLDLALQDGGCAPCTRGRQLDPKPPPRRETFPATRKKFKWHPPAGGNSLAPKRNMGLNHIKILPFKTRAQPSHNLADDNAFT